MVSTFYWVGIQRRQYFKSPWGEVLPRRLAETGSWVVIEVCQSTGSSLNLKKYFCEVRKPDLSSKEFSTLLLAWEDARVWAHRNPSFHASHLSWGLMPCLLSHPEFLGLTLRSGCNLIAVSDWGSIPPFWAPWRSWKLMTLSSWFTAMAGSLSILLDLWSTEM